MPSNTPTRQTGPTPFSQSGKGSRTLEPASAEGGVTGCLHCGLPVPRARRDRDPADAFCCAGCQTVYETLNACGLDHYYALRAAVNAAPARGAATGARYAAFDADAFADAHVRRLDGGRRVIDLRLDGVHCAACVWLVERLPRVRHGVIEARLSLRESAVRVTWDPDRVPLSQIAETLDRLGYPPHPLRGADARRHRRRGERRELLAIGVAGLCAGNAMLTALALYAGEGAFGATTMQPGVEQLLRWTCAALGLVALAGPGAVFFRGARAALATRTPTLDVPIALALAAGGLAGAVNVVLGAGAIYFDSLAVLVFLLRVGRFVQARQQRRADDAVGLMAAFTPAACRVRRGGEWVETPLEALAPRDHVRVRAGELFPADGRVTAGRSSLDRSLLTGESVAVPVGPGDGVFAGARNLDAALEVEVTAARDDTRVAALVRLVEEGVRAKPPLVLFADRVAGWFVVVVSLAAAATFAGWLAAAGIGPAVEHAVALLIVACPCALGLATPLALAVAIARAGRRDILIKNGAAVEALARPGVLLLDKTGTLTHGRAQLVAWHGDPALRSVVAAAEADSIHPVARALTAALTDDGDPAPPRVTDVVERGDGGLAARHADQPLAIGSPGFLERRGLTLPRDLHTAADRHLAAGQTVVGVALGGRVRALAALGDTLRDGSAHAVAQLQARGWRPRILSGDATPVVHQVATRLGLPVDHARGDLTPEDKLAAVRQLRPAPGSAVPSSPTVLVGDGVNDAAALAAADVGVAVHGGAEAALAAADVYVARPGLTPLVELVQLARASVRAARRSLVISLAYNALAITLAAAGLITPLLAAVLMPASSAVVLASALAPGRREARP